MPEKILSVFDPFLFSLSFSFFFSNFSFFLRLKKLIPFLSKFLPTLAAPATNPTLAIVGAANMATPATARPLNIFLTNPPPFFFFFVPFDSLSTNLIARPLAFSINSIDSFILLVALSSPPANPFKEFKPPSNILPKNLLGSNESTFSSILFVNFGIRF